MKKSILLLLFSVLLFSCSKTEVEKAPDPTLLKKIIKNPNTAGEEHWNFDDNGYLKEIVQKDGTVLFSFQFDANGNLINPICSDCKNYVYDPTKYSYTKEYPIGSGGMNILYLGQKGELFSYIYELVSADEFIYCNFRYDENNIITKSYSINQEYSFSYNYDDKINPLKKSIVPIINEFMWFNKCDYKEKNSKFWFIFDNIQYSSTNNPQYSYEAEMRNDYDTKFYYNSLGLPKVESITAYDFDKYTLKTTYGTPRIVSIYYYQGDIIP